MYLYIEEVHGRYMIKYSCMHVCICLFMYICCQTCMTLYTSMYVCRQAYMNVWMYKMDRHYMCA